MLLKCPISTWKFPKRTAPHKKVSEMDSSTQNSFRNGQLHTTKVSEMDSKKKTFFFCWRNEFFFFFFSVACTQKNFSLVNNFFFSRDKIAMVGRFHFRCSVNGKVFLSLFTESDIRIFRCSVRKQGFSSFPNTPGWPRWVGSQWGKE